MIMTRSIKKAIVAPFAGVWIEISFTIYYHPRVDHVAPFAGVWIEMSNTVISAIPVGVAPFAGVWIEIHFGRLIFSTTPVAPFAGVWIEIRSDLIYSKVPSRRTLRGCVD